MTTTALVSNTVREGLVDREKTLIVRTQQMLDAVKSQGAGNSWTYKNIIKLAKQRLSALQAGLVPVRLGGRSFPLRVLLNEAQYVPPQIVAQAEAVAERLPGAVLRVYGWERDALPEVRRRRDPVLTAYYGASEFFVGFWLEVETADEDVPEFFGITAPLLPKPGRGRPKKALTNKAQQG